MKHDKPIRYGRVAGAVSVAAAVLWLATFGSFHQEVRVSAEGGYPLPEFRLPVLNPGLFEEDTSYLGSEDLTGKVALVAFWATWCSPCIAEQPSLLALQDEFGESGLVVLGVLHQDRPEPALRWLLDHDRLDFRTVVGTRDLARESKASGGLPVTLLVDRGGRVTGRFLGYWPDRDAYVREAVQHLLGS